VSELPQIQFTDGHRLLSLTVLGRAIPDAIQDWDRDALVARVSVRAGVFTGTFQTWLWSHELVALRAVLRQLDQSIGHAVERSFQLREATVTVQFALSQTGQVELFVTAVPEPAADESLQFRMAADQTALASWIAAITAALEAFPPQIASG
jgi:hypothetical protein